MRPRTPPAGALAESVPPSARKLLTELGVLEAVEAAGFHPNGGNTVWWAGRNRRVESFDLDEYGFHVDRAGLEDVLVSAAESTGVRVYEGASARTAAEAEAGWTVQCDAGNGNSIELRSPWVLDATGRHGLLARGEGREPDRSTTTLALVRRWRKAGGWGSDLASHTLVESYEDGWAWSVPLDTELRCFTAMIDQRHAELEGADVAAMLNRQLARTSHLGPGLAGAEPVGDAWACPASLYTSARFARPGLLLVGDAGSFIDPLSSFGVKKALSSGWLAAVVTHTALIDAPMTETAVDFFDTREREVYRSYRDASARFFEDAAEAYGTEYWVARAEAARIAAGDREGHARASRAGAPERDPDRLGAPSVPEADVRAAFDRIRDQGRLRAVEGETLTTFERPGIDGHRIVWEDHLASEAYPEGMRYVRSVDLRRLVEVAPRFDDVPDGWGAYNGLATPVTLPDYLAALATAFAAGFLQHRGD